MVFYRFFLLATLLSGSFITKVQAEETDQFTLPPVALQDIGSAASQQLYAVLEKVVAQTNEDIQRLLPLAKRNPIAAHHLAVRLGDAYIPDRVYANTGPGFPRWLRWRLLPQKLKTKPLEYKEIWPWKTVYWLVFSQCPFSLIGLASTVNMYGYDFGADKLGHFFMQGHTYYTIYNFLIKHGKTAQQAHDIMIMYGQALEHTYLGTLINGVYSNGDLSGNYAGWKFYTNIAHPITIGKKTWPAILVRNGHTWEFSKARSLDNLKQNLLKPFISDNLNEAFNPCKYSFMRGQIRRQIKKRCPRWIKEKGLTPVLVNAKLKETQLWHGENYGHWLPSSKAVTLNSCFGGK